MEILDILYETEDTSLLFNCPCSLAASTLVRMLHSNCTYLGKKHCSKAMPNTSCFNPFQVAAYAISVPKQTWEFPILPWGKQLEQSSLFTYNLILSIHLEQCEQHLLQLRSLRYLGIYCNKEYWVNTWGDTLKQLPFAVRFATSYDEEEIMKIVLTILLHVLKLDGIEEKGKGRFDARCLSWVCDM